MNKAPQTIAAVAVYSMLLGVGYGVVYWGQFGINPFEYLQLSDLVKISTIPLIFGFVALIIGLIVGNIFPLNFLETSGFNWVSRRVARDCALFDILKAGYLLLLIIVVMGSGSGKHIILGLMVPPVVCFYIRDFDFFLDSFPGVGTRTVVVYCLCALPFCSLQCGHQDAMAVIDGRKCLYKETDGGYVSASPSNYTMEKSSEQTRHCCSISLNRRIRGSSRTSGMLGISS